jgi:hypothetical protein
VKPNGAVAFSLGWLLLAPSAHAQTANSQTDGRDYEALAYLPKDTLVGLTYFREASTSATQSFSQFEGIFRASYVLKYGNLAIVPFDAILPVVDATVYVPTMSGATATLHTSGVADATYLPTIGYIVPEGEATHTVLAATAYVTAPTGSYDTANLVNIGDHRWRIQPQVAASQRFAKALTFDLIGNMVFYTSNSEFVVGQPMLPTASMSQNPTFGLEAHLTADLGPDAYLGVSYYVAAIGERDIQAPGVPKTQVDPEQTLQTLRFTFGVRVEKATLILLQYNQDIEESGGASIGRFVGVRLSHAVFF